MESNSGPSVNKRRINCFVYEMLLHAWKSGNQSGTHYGFCPLWWFTPMQTFVSGFFFKTHRKVPVINIHYIRRLIQTTEVIHILCWAKGLAPDSPLLGIPAAFLLINEKCVTIWNVVNIYITYIDLCFLQCLPLFVASVRYVLNNGKWKLFFLRSQLRSRRFWSIRYRNVDMVCFSPVTLPLSRRCFSKFKIEY